MPRFAHIFEAAEDTLNAYYRALAQRNIDQLMALWLDEDFVICVCADGTYLYGLSAIRQGLADRFEASPVTVEPLEVHVYNSLGTVVYAITEAHRPLDQNELPTLVFSTCVMVHERGAWRIAHIHASRMPDAVASAFSASLSHRHGPLH
jgi:hypothetical protein